MLSFTLIEGGLSRGFRTPMPQHRTDVQAVGTSLNLVSVLVGLGTVWLLGAAFSAPAMWAVAPFVGAVVYLFLESLETALAERVVAARGDPDAVDVSP